MSGRVWLPESSLAEGKGAGTLVNAQEPPEERQKGGIVRRTTPTVDLTTLDSAASARQAAKTKENQRQNYSTIEKSVYTQKSFALDSVGGRSYSNVNNPEFCGWETGGERSALESSSSVNRRRCAAERGSLSTPADGYRSGVPSRAASRAGGARKKDFYEFKHFTDTRSYIEDYCCRYSYTALSVPRESADAIREEGRGGREEECCCSGKRRLHTGGQAVHRAQQMQQLASRLGVRVKESINEKQLRYRRTQPTAPSFTKNNRMAEDLLVSTQQDTLPTEDQVAHISAQKQILSQHEPEADSRAVSASQDRPRTTAASVELPRILAKMRAQNNKILSTTSVTKYLTISSRPQCILPPGLGEEESAVDVSSHDSIGEPIPSISSETLVEDAVTPVMNNPQTMTSPRMWNVADAYTRGVSRGLQPAMFDEVWRDRVLTQKAQALGLLSRDWAQASRLKKVIGEGTTSYRHSLSTASGKEQPPGKVEKKDNAISSSRPRTFRENSTSRTKDSEKLEKLRSIYKPAGATQSKRSTSRQQQPMAKHKCESKLSKRPSTTSDDIDRDQREKERKSRHHSRPSTKLGKKLPHSEGAPRPVFSLEESQYWNEVPIRDHQQSQFQAGNGLHLRVDSRSITRGEDSRPLRSVKLYSEGKLLTMKRSHHSRPPEVAPASYEPGGQHSRNPGSATRKLSAFSRKMRRFDGHGHVEANFSISPIA